MSKIKDRSGMVFGRLTVVRLHSIKNNRALWECKCQCGETKLAIGKVLANGGTKSCGCLRRDLMTKHGLSKNPKIKTEYKTWKSILNKCNNPKASNYKDYGGRGISVCKRWEDFNNFITDMGLKPCKTLSIERINNDGDYEPNNCKWATDTEQNRNKRNIRIISFNGESLLLEDWARKTGLSKQCISYRLKKGWGVKNALTIPKKNNNKTNDALQLLGFL